MTTPTPDTTKNPDPLKNPDEYTDEEHLEGSGGNSLWIVWMVSLGLIGLGFAITWQFVKPAPPHEFRLAAGQEGGRYHTFALRLAEELSHDGVEVHVVTSEGSIQNLESLRDPNSGVDMALVQSGAETEADHATLLALGSLFYEPVWIFVRDGLQADRLGQLATSRIAVGAVGSGTRSVALTALREVGVPEDAANLLPIGGAEAADALAAGAVDVAFFVMSLDSPLIERLLRMPGLRLLPVRQIQAYTARYPFLSGIVLGEGMLDLQALIPAEDVPMLATTANLVVTHDFHPALIPLVLQKTRRILARGGLLEAPEEFPSGLHTALPLAEDAERFHQAGAPFLQRYLPFWAASLVDRLKIMILPLLTLAIPLVRLVMPTWRWRMRARIYRWYRTLQDVDGRRKVTKKPNPQRDISKLEELRSEIMGMRVPLAYSYELYDLHMHIDHAIRRIRDEEQERKSAAEDSQ